MSRLRNFGSAGLGVYVQLRHLLTSPYYNMNQTVGRLTANMACFYRNNLKHEGVRVQKLSATLEQNSLTLTHHCMFGSQRIKSISGLPMGFP